MVTALDRSAPFYRELPEVGNRRNLLAIQTIVVTYLAAVRSLSKHPEPDLRVLMAEQARDRALQLLDKLASSGIYEDDSLADAAIRKARQVVEDYRDEGGKR